MTGNLELWEKLGKTDPSHTKQFKRGGGFAGTAIKPMWSYKRMTEEFGPCGTGWGIGEPSFQVVPGPEGEVLVFCTASIWYGADKATVFGVGGDKAVGKNKYGLQTDDEAFKKAFTDAITNALKMIGVGADVHMGMFDDNKYVNTMRDEFSEPRPEAKKTSADDQSKQLSKAEARAPFDALMKSMRQNTTRSDLKAWWFDPDCQDERSKMPKDWQKNLYDEFVSHGSSLPEEQKEAA